LIVSSRYKLLPQRVAMAVNTKVWQKRPLMTAITGLSYTSTCTFPRSATFLLSGIYPQVGCPNARTISSALNPPVALRRTPIMACPTAGLIAKNNVPVTPMTGLI